MKVTRSMLHPSLKKTWLPGKIMAFLLSRERSVRILYKFGSKLKGKNIQGLHCEEKVISGSKSGPGIRIRIYKPENTSGSLPGMLYLHGGGYMIGNPESFPMIIKSFIDTTPCIIVAPDYRKSLEAPFPAGFDDCYETLLWMKENAETLGILPERFIVGGHSAGGGLTAAVCLKARDTGDVRIAFQMPVYPMIDDRQQHPSSALDSLVWNTKSNQLGWKLYLKGLQDSGQEIPEYAAPARATDFRNLPPAITFVGDLEPFRDETIRWVEELENAGVQVAFKLFEGCYHAFDVLGGEAEVSKAANQFLLDHFRDYVKKYF